MKDKITLQKALAKHDKIINISIVMLIIGLVVTGILGLKFIQTKSITFTIFLIGIILSSGITFIFYRTKLRKWIFWAFLHVDDVHELRQRTKWFLPNDTWRDVTKTENSLEKELIHQINQRFEQESNVSSQNKTESSKQVQNDSHVLPPRTEIMLSSNIKTFVYVVLIISFIALIYALHLREFLGAVVAGFMVLIGYFRIKDFSAKAPQIVLSYSGIQLTKHGFTPWKKVKKIGVETVLESSGQWISYLYINEERLVNIQDLDITGKELEELIKAYQQHAQLNTPKKKNKS